MTDLEQAIEAALEHHSPEPLGSLLACACQPDHAMSPAVYRRHAAAVVSAYLVENAKRRLEQRALQARQQAAVEEVLRGKP